MVQVLRTTTLAPDPAYDDLADDFRVSLSAGRLLQFTDVVGFYPRPFPGEDRSGRSVGPE